MLKKLVILMMLSLTGCAHATIHQICSRPDVLEKYQDYNECYKEETAERQRKHERKQNFARNWSNSFASHKSTNCQSVTNGAFTSTNCN
jgi:hypothetical protein